jgi:hypothetical protein
MGKPVVLDRVWHQPAGQIRGRTLERTLLPYSPFTPGLVSVTMPMAHNDSVIVAGEMRKNISKCDAPHTLLVR